MDEQSEAKDFFASAAANEKDELEDELNDLEAMDCGEMMSADVGMDYAVAPVMAPVAPKIKPSF